MMFMALRDHVTSVLQGFFEHRMGLLLICRKNTLGFAEDGLSTSPRAQRREEEGFCDSSDSYRRSTTPLVWFAVA
jgi:hypothetical protein